jgi:hypothetical protein
LDCRNVTDALRSGEPALASEIVPEIDADAAFSTGAVDEIVEVVEGVCWARDPADHAKSTMPRNIHLDLIF